MHEVSIMQSALDIAERHARTNGAQRIHRVTLRIGDLAGVVPDALEFAFDAVTAGTMAEGATLVVERIPAAAYCRPCGAEFEPRDLISECPVCRTPSGDIRRGREMEMAGLEVS